MKKGKELKINKFKNYNVAFGSVNNKNPKAIYINITAWAEPLFDEDINYHRVIKDLHKKTKQHIYNYLSASDKGIFAKQNTILDLDIRESGIKFGKRSFMSCEITMYLDVNIVANSDIMKENLNYMIPTILKDVFENNKTFKFNKKK